MKIKDVNKLDKKLMRRFQKIDGFGVPTFAEVSFMLPRFIEDEKGNVYISGMAQGISWTQANHDSFMPYYKLHRGKNRRFHGMDNKGYLTWPDHWVSDTEYNAKASLLLFLFDKGYYSPERALKRIKSGLEEKGKSANETT